MSELGWRLTSRIESLLQTTDCGQVGAAFNQYWLKPIGQASFSRKNMQKVLEENIENCSRRCSWRVTNLEQEEN